jgi:hypothetical protein
MKVTGFTFVRNALRYDFPVLESIRSLLPICDEVMVSVGKSDDGTRELIEGIGSSKIRISDSIWDEMQREGGKVLAAETNKAFDLVPGDGIWCIYLQADEVLHEHDYPKIIEAMNRFANDLRVEGLLLRYRHFYGSYEYIGDSRKWYGQEVRILRNDKNIRSYRDAQGFRKEGRKLRVKPVDAFVYHYGWVRHPGSQLRKINDFHRLWTLSDEPLLKLSTGEGGQFDYSGIDSLQRFEGPHPQVMLDRIAAKNWTIELDTHWKNFSVKQRVLYWIERKFGKRLFEYKNYRII